MTLEDGRRKGLEEPDLKPESLRVYETITVGRKFAIKFSRERFGDYKKDFITVIAAQGVTAEIEDAEDWKANQTTSAVNGCVVQKYRIPPPKRTMPRVNVNGYTVAMEQTNIEGSKVINAFISPVSEPELVEKISDLSIIQITQLLVPTSSPESS